MGMKWVRGVMALACVAQGSATWAQTPLRTRLSAPTQSVPQAAQDDMGLRAMWDQVPPWTTVAPAAGTKSTQVEPSVVLALVKGVLSECELMPEGYSPGFWFTERASKKQTECAAKKAFDNYYKWRSAGGAQAQAQALLPLWRALLFYAEPEAQWLALDILLTNDSLLLSEQELSLIARYLSDKDSEACAQLVSTMELNSRKISEREHVERIPLAAAVPFVMGLGKAKPAWRSLMLAPLEKLLRDRPKSLAAHLKPYLAELKEWALHPQADANGLACELMMLADPAQGYRLLEEVVTQPDLPEAHRAVCQYGAYGHWRTLADKALKDASALAEVKRLFGLQLQSLEGFLASLESDDTDEEVETRQGHIKMLSPFVLMGSKELVALRSEHHSWFEESRVVRVLVQVALSPQIEERIRHTAMMVLAQWGRHEMVKHIVATGEFDSDDLHNTTGTLRNEHDVDLDWRERFRH